MTAEGQWLQAWARSLDGPPSPGHRTRWVTNPELRLVAATCRRCGWVVVSGYTRRRRSVEWGVRLRAWSHRVHRNADETFPEPW